MSDIREGRHESIGMPPAVSGSPLALRLLGAVEADQGQGAIAGHRADRADSRVAGHDFAARLQGRFALDR